MPQLRHGSEMAGYRIEGVAGRGGMGVVYRATDLALERPVALKLISEELAEDERFRSRFKRESRLAASIRHPNVITIFRAGEEDGCLYIAMEYVNGTDLRTLIATRGSLPPPLAARLLSEVAAALDAAHAKTLVHRDVKSANVLVAGGPDSYHAYLTDFGLTKPSHSRSVMTETGTFVGSVDYMAPEQIVGDRLDARADIYSLGCVLYEALTGQVPYPRNSDVAKLYAHTHDAAPSVSELAPGSPPLFDAIVSRALAKDPEERYRSAGDLGRAALGAATGTMVTLAERNVAAGEAAPPGPPVESGSRTTEPSRTQPTGPPESDAPPVADAPTRAPRRGLPRSLLAAAALLLAITAAALLARGGDEGPSRGPTKDQYQDRILDAGLPFSAQEEALRGRLPARVNTSTDQSRATRVLTRFRETTDRLIAALQGTTPPTDVMDLHARTIEGFKRVRKRIAAGAAAAVFGNDRAYRATPGRIQVEIRLLRTLGPRFGARGYERLALATG